MPVLVGEIGPIKVNCLIWTGVVSRSEALGFPARIDPSRPEFGRRWITYFDAGADISDMDAACVIELRERLRPVTAALAAKGELRVILVSNSRYNDPFLAMWRTLAATDATYASNPELVHDIDSAAQALGLSAADAEQVRAWIDSQIERTSGEGR
ncbi:MAG TPA: hypothetical protein VN805_15085 [Caulobacteraceae bacterium]|nr:hypothetical protein [Caulobacteraceae bacterium]